MLIGNISLLVSLANAYLNLSAIIVISYKHIYALSLVMEIVYAFAMSAVLDQLTDGRWSALLTFQSVSFQLLPLQLINGTTQTEGAANSFVDI